MNRVYIYRQPLPEHYEEALVNLCEESWRRQGWKVIPTTLADAKLHNQWDNLNNNTRNLTARKPFTQRELASYYKWLAFSECLKINENRCGLVGGLAVDFDIINYGFTPEIMLEIIEKSDPDCVQIMGEYGYSFDREPYLRPPTPVHCMTRALVDEMIQKFVEYEDNSRTAEYAKRRRPNSALKQGVDEQSLINDVLWDSGLIEHIPCCPMYNSVNYESVPWREASLVHYTNWSVAKKHVRTRYKTIMRERPPF